MDHRCECGQLHNPSWDNQSYPTGKAAFELPLLICAADKRNIIKKRNFISVCVLMSLDFGKENPEQVLHGVSNLSSSSEETNNMSYKLVKSQLRFEFFTAATMKKVIFWGASLCGSCRNAAC
jgi:hypothetical protein